MSHFETDVIHSNEAVQNLKVKSENILAVQGLIHPGQAFASGLLRVQTKNGRFALKVFQDGNPLKELATTIVIQNELARRGLAPKIEGVLNSVSVARLLEKMPSIRPLLQEPEHSFAVLMEEVPVISHVSAGHVDFIPESWPKERLEHRLQEIEKALSELRIPTPEDLQLVFTLDDRLLLLDFDTYYHVSKDGLVIRPFLGTTTSLSRFLSDSDHQSFQNGETKLLPNGDLKVRLLRLRKRLGLPGGSGS